MDVLLVDDNRELRTATRELLEVLGHRVIEAASGDVALERSSAGSVDLLVTDLTMPGVDGVELTDRMLLQSPDLAVLMVSSETHDPRLRGRLSRGDMAFVAKPFSATALAEGIDDALAAAKTRTTASPPKSALSEEPESRRASRRLPSREDGPRVPRAEPRRRVPRRGVSRWRPLALAAVTALTAAMAIFFLEPGPPELPVPPSTSVVRGSEVELLHPVGPIAELPMAFRWQPVDGAVLYQLTVRAVDESVVWQGEVDSSRLELPVELTTSLLPAVAYTWTVTALDASGDRLAWSARTRFRVLPSAADTP